MLGQWKGAIFTESKRVREAESGRERLREKVNK